MSMRRFAFVPALALAVGLIASPVAAAEPDTVYVALGDSLAWGDGASDPATTAYVPLMAEYFAGAAHGNAKTAVNLAVRGETTGSFMAGQMSAALGTILDPSTDTRVVTLSIGGNDLLNLLNEPTDTCVINPASLECQIGLAQALGEVANNYPTIMGTLAFALANDPGTEKVFVLTLYNPFGGTGSPFEAAVDQGLLGVDLTVDCAAAQANPMNAGLNDIVSCTSAFFGATVVDGYQTIGDNALALTHIGDPGFNIHPNDDGYAAIAKA
ncbi:MAG TPA: SGNH/GDSL hydrolase family protein, partial [Candidatus Limnocylindria bacterium]